MDGVLAGSGGRKTCLQINFRCLILDMQRSAKSTFTPDEFLALERVSLSKHEFFEGEIFSLAGASRNHNSINRNLLSEIHQGLKPSGSSCKVYNQDMRINVHTNGLFTYPDVVAVCEPERYLPHAELDTLLNPVFIAEILSDSTESYDRVKKFELYKGIPEFKEYLLVHTRRRLIERFNYSSEGWKTMSFVEGRFSLLSLNIMLSVDDIYFDVPL